MEDQIIFQYSLHQKLWNLLAKYPEKDKTEILDEYFTEYEQKEFRYNECAACTYVNNMYKVHTPHVLNCNELCPLDFNKIYDSAFESICLGGLYYEYATAQSNASYTSDYNDIKDASRLARKIANLPVREGIPYV